MADSAAAGSEKASGPSLDVEVATDTLTAQEGAPGLAQAYVARTLVAAADDIADIVVRATNERRVDVLVASSADVRSDADRALAVRLQLDSLTTRLDAMLPEPVADPPEGASDGDVGSLRRILPAAVASLAAGILQVLPSAAGTLTKLLAHQYFTSGVTLETVQGAIDLRVAGAIRRKLPGDSALSVRIERLWTPDDSPLLGELRALLARYDELLTEIAVAAGEQERARADLDSATSARSAAQSQLVELSKSLDPAADLATGSAWRVAWDYATARADQDPTILVVAHESASARLARLQELQGAVEQFLVSLVAPGTSGELPLAAAMRGEWLSGEGDADRMILYARVLHGGVDQVIDLQVTTDRRTVLAGSGVEFALVASDGAVVAAGVRDNLWGGVMRLRKVSDFRGGPVDSAFEPNATRVEPPGSGNH